MKQLEVAVLLLALGLVTVCALPQAKAGTAAIPPRPRFASSSDGGGTNGAAGDESHASTRAGGEWWVKDPPWFLPPPPEWGPMPPTMYTSYFHKPRYPALSTANYYPLYSRTDEYDAHLPASMSRRAAYTQQQIYDHYVATYRAHTDGGEMGGSDPNFGVSNPTLTGSTNAPNLGEAHGRALGMQSPNNYFPLFTQGGGASQASFPAHGGGFGFVETGSRMYHTPNSVSPNSDRSVSYFTASEEPAFIEADSHSSLDGVETDESDESDESADETEEEESDE